ncbi:sensor histidine kinase [Roseicella frigidaeris]|uniref:histidine kinase n=1 Tax=Roseicella frigidaeris TaxID=2230885 RepID=A0A327LZG1_9PROT|nr:PAS domain-containing protein [Roseicella frigidaeris]RAI55385.1 hypothetical protein DOO78_23775 [Roseicella frigidaeris]
MSHQPLISSATLALLRRIAEAVPGPVAVLQAPGWVVVHANRAWQALAASAGGEPTDTATDAAAPASIGASIGATLADCLPGFATAGGAALLEEARRSGRALRRRGWPVRARPEAAPVWWDIEAQPLAEAPETAEAVLLILRDVTGEVLARREAAQARAVLERQAAQLRLAIGAGRMRFWDWDIATGRIAWSEGEAAATPEAFLARAHAEDRAGLRAALDAALAGATSFDHAFRRADAPGEAWLLSRASVLRDAAGRPERLVGLDLDLTEHRRAEAERAEQAARLALVEEVAEFGLWDWDGPSGRQVWSARQFALHGLDPAAGAPGLEAWLDMVHPADRRRLRQALRTGFSDGAGRYRVLFRIARADDGAERWLAGLGQVLEAWPDGRPRRMRGINLDVTGLLGQAMTTLARESEVLRAAIDAAPDCIKLVELDGRLSVVNASGLGLLEIEDAAAVLGQDWAALWPEAGRPRVRAALAEALAGRNDRFEALCPTARGRPRWWDVAVAPVRDLAGRVQRVIAISRDITARKETEARLQDAVAVREMLVREADHRIKNSLQMAAGLLRLQQGRSEEPAVRLALARAEARVLAVAESHRALHGSPDLRSIDLGQVLRDLCAHLGSLSPALTLRCHAVGELPLDAERGIPFGLLANELLTNALQHAYPEGAPGLVEAVLALEGEEVVLRVTDAGRGLPAPGAAQGAAPGASGAAEGAPAGAGRSGLGSTLLRSLARQLGARIETESAPGQGTRVTVRMPLRPAEPAAAPEGIPREGNPPEGGPREG